MISRCKFCKNRFFNSLFPLSHTFYFETRPSPLSKLGENAFGSHFLQLYRKNEYGDPHFLFGDFNKDSASFPWEKNWHKSMFSFLAILLNCTDWAITGRIARVQFNSTLERKVKTRELKGIKTIHWSQILCDTACIIEKMSPFCLVLGCARHCNVKTSTVAPTFYYFFIIFLTCHISVPSYICNLC